MTAKSSASSEKPALAPRVANTSTHAGLSDELDAPF
jgi:hypothetical protein